MKPIKIAVPFVLAVFVALGWVTTISSMADTVTQHATTLELAEQSYADGLYLQAIQQYKQALAEGSGVEVYERLIDIYRTWYAEEGAYDGSIRDSWLNDMTDAYFAYPSHTEFWDIALSMYLEDEDYRDAYTVVSDARRQGVESELVERTYAELRLMTQGVDTNNTTFDEVRSPMNGSYVAHAEDMWFCTNNVGGSYLAGSVMGTPNEQGLVICVGSFDARLLDSAGVPRARYHDLKIQDAGMLDSESGLVPVKVAGSWRYLAAWTGELQAGTYDEAGTYGSGYAAVRNGDEWSIIDVEGNVAGGPYDDMVLSPSRRIWCDAGIALIGQNGSYGIYDASLQPVSDFSCDELDTCVDGGAMAFRRGSLWGFVATDGTVVCEPRFKGARSFSTGRAAVQGDTLYEDPHYELLDLPSDAATNGWGFVDEGFNVVVPYQYFDAYYFNGSNAALVCSEPDVYRFITFTYA